jgi:hypothetical protein
MATPSSDNVAGRKITDGGELTKECSDIEEAIAALRMSYEQYFLGIDRKPPTNDHKELKRRIERVRSSFTRQTAAKFRVQSIVAKFTTYERLWSRTLMEMENGTYRRDLFKARLHAQDRNKKPEDKQESAPAPAQAPAPAKPAAPAAAAAPASNVPGEALSDQKLKAVFNAYLTAKKQCREDVSKLSYEQVAANLRKQVPELMKKTGASGVEFKVVIKDGKAILRAVPK